MNQTKIIIQCFTNDNFRFWRQTVGISWCAFGYYRRNLLQHIFSTRANVLLACFWSLMTCITDLLLRWTTPDVRMQRSSYMSDTDSRIFPMRGERRRGERLLCGCTRKRRPCRTTTPWWCAGGRCPSFDLSSLTSALCERMRFDTTLSTSGCWPRSLRSVDRDLLLKSELDLPLVAVGRCFPDRGACNVRLESTLELAISPFTTKFSISLATDFQINNR